MRGWGNVPHGLEGWKSDVCASECASQDSYEHKAGHTISTSIIEMSSEV